MNMIHVFPVILCGGSGTRLWPLSRAGFPKQFISLTGEEHRFLASEQLREAGIELGAALLESVGRNTPPAITLAALAAQQNGTDPVLVVTPAD